jgi:hypothetical protein
MSLRIKTSGQGNGSTVHHKKQHSNSGKRIYERNIGGIVKILFDFLRLCFIQSILTFAAVKLVPLLRRVIVP